MFIVFLYSCLSYIIDVIMGRQLDRLMPFWQPANILHSVLIFMLLWQINIVVVVKRIIIPVLFLFVCDFL